MSKAIDNQRKRMLENFKQFRKTDGDKLFRKVSEILQDEELMEEVGLLISRSMDGKPANKNSLVEIPVPEMRLYYIDDNYFESIDELLHYCRINNKSTKGLKILDYYREFAGRSDVIRKQDCDTIMLYTAVDEYGYGIMYNNERSINRGEFKWEYNHGSIRKMYKPFRDKGVVFENDIYAKQDEEMQHILKYCRENSLFNMGKK